MKTVKSTILLSLFLAILLYVFYVYDISQDPSMHTCTQACVLEGCPFENE